MVMNALRRLLTAATIVVGPMNVQAADDFDARRARLVDEIAAQMRATRDETGRERLSECVERALRTVPRHRFVPPELERNAYGDHPLPIGLGQTISQPFIVALMTELARSRAVRARAGGRYRIRLPGGGPRPVRVRASTRSKSCGRWARGRAACWPSWVIATSTCASATATRDGPTPAPFDAIVVTAAPDHVPQPLVDQLAPNGKMVIPVGSHHGIQDLLVITKDADGRAVTRRTLAVRFVPLTREK